MRRAKTIDELYEEVRDFDVVLCNDAPLMTALNNRIDTLRIGDLAVTPRYIVKERSIQILGESIWDDLHVISHIADETGYDIRFVHGEVENIRTIRRYTQDVKRHLYGRSKRIYDIFKELPTEERAMDIYNAVEDELFIGKKVAIIGLDLFNDLDKHFIPATYEEVEMFTDGEYQIAGIYEEGNDRQIADDAVDLITAENAQEVAIVLDPESPMADAVRSALYRKGIPFKNTLPARDLVQIRDYLEMLDLSLSYDTIKAGQVREIMSSCGGSIPLEYDDYRLSRIDDILDERSREITDAMRDVRSKTYREFCDIVIQGNDKKRDGLYRAPIKTVLGSLGIIDAIISDDGVASMSYVINNMEPDHNEQIPEDENRGVMLADCRNSTFIDRRIVMYLGLGQEWYKIPQGKRYIDWEDERERNAMRFMILLQQGNVRIHMVNAMRNGKTARPCVLFDDILERKVKEFKDLAKISKGGWSEGSDATSLRRQNIEIDVKERLFTKSSFNQYVTCPRSFMYSSLVRTPASRSSVFGNTVHEFAEFCLCYPELVERNGIDHYAELIWQQYSRMASDERKVVDKCRITVALTNVLHFVRSLNIKVPLDTPSKHNFLMEHHGLKETSSITEASLKATRSPLYGRFDLLIDGMIVDFKTGKWKDADEVKKNMGTSSSVKYPEFQPIVYLTILDDTDSEGKGFRMFNVMGNPEAALNGEPDLSGCFVDVKKKRFAEFVKDDLRRMAGEKSQPLEDDWDEVAERMIFLGIPEPVEKWTEDDALLDIMKRANKGKAVKRIINSLSASVTGWAANDSDSLTIFNENIEKFRSLVKEEHDTMVQQRTTSFIVNTERCSDCGFFGLCTAAEVDDEQIE